jgi:hypothetical protein
VPGVELCVARRLRGELLEPGEGGSAPFLAAHQPCSKDPGLIPEPSTLQRASCQSRPGRCRQTSHHRCRPGPEFGWIHPDEARSRWSAAVDESVESAGSGDGSANRSFTPVRLDASALESKGCCLAGQAGSGRASCAWRRVSYQCRGARARTAGFVYVSDIDDIF